MNYNACFYDPMLGRFTSPDSIVPEPGSVIGYNRYAYVNNNPMIYTDPRGHVIMEGIGACMSMFEQLAKTYETVANNTSYSAYHGHVHKHLSSVIYYARSSGIAQASKYNLEQTINSKTRLIINGYTRSKVQAISTAFGESGAMHMSGAAGAVGISGVMVSPTKSGNTEFNIMYQYENFSYTTIYPSSNPCQNILALHGNNTRAHTDKYFNSEQGDTNLRNRAANSSASHTSFSNIYQAESIIKMTLNANQSDIIQKANSLHPPRIYSYYNPVGILAQYSGYKNVNGTIMSVNGIAPVKEVVWFDGIGGWGLYTAYQTP